MKGILWGIRFALNCRMAVGAQQSSPAIQVLASNVLRWDIGQGLGYHFPLLPGLIFILIQRVPQ